MMVTASESVSMKEGAEARKHKLSEVSGEEEKSLLKRVRTVSNGSAAALTGGDAMTCETNTAVCTANKPKGKILSQGAEGIIRLVDYVGGRQAVRKERAHKRYRFAELDGKLRGRRVSQEARVIGRLQKAGIAVPAIYEVDTRQGTLIMQFIEGLTLKQYLQTQDQGFDKKILMMGKVGKIISMLHSHDVVHGDLTSGNIMIEEEKRGGRIVLIDFGLSFSNATDEDFAVDLYVFERAVQTTHDNSGGEADKLIGAFMSEYFSDENSRGVEIKRKYEQVKARGRKRDMVG